MYVGRKGIIILKAYELRLLSSLEPWDKKVKVSKISGVCIVWMKYRHHNSIAIEFWAVRTGLELALGLGL